MKIRVAAWVALLSLSCLAVAQDRDTDSLRSTYEEQFNELDSNDDGQLDESELAKLTPNEIAALQSHGLPDEPPIRRDVFVASSIGMSLAIMPTPEEMPAKADEESDGRDSKGSKGENSKTESGKSADSSKPGLTLPGRNPTKKGHYVPELPAEFVARDKNHDGQIALYEWDRKKYAEFTKLDKNGDGFLTPTELLSKEALKTLYSKATARVTPGSGGSVSPGSVTPGSMPAGGGESDVDKEARSTFSQMDENKDGNIDESDWGRSRRIRPWFESAGIKVNLPMNAESFVAHYRRAKESGGR